MELNYTQEPLSLSSENDCAVPNEIKPVMVSGIPLQSCDQDESYPFLNTSLSKDNLDGQSSSNVCSKLNSCHHCNMSFESVSFIDMLTHNCEKPGEQVSDETSCENNDFKNCIQSQTASERVEYNERHKLLPTKEGWKRHVRETHGEKRFQCQVCEKWFARGFNLKKHMLTHTGEKPCVCDICGKCFRLSSFWKEHIRTHTGEKPCVCDICGKCFTHNGTLMRHMLTHTGSKP